MATITYRIAIDSYVSMTEAEFVATYSDHARTLLQFSRSPQRNIALWLWRGEDELRLSNDWLPIPNTYTLTIEREGTGMTFYDIPTMAKHLQSAAETLRKKVYERAMHLELLLLSAQDQFERGKLPLYYSGVRTISPLREFCYDIDRLLCAARAFDTYLAERIERDYNNLRDIDLAEEQLRLRLDHDYIEEMTEKSELSGYSLASFSPEQRDNLRSGGQDALRNPKVAEEVSRLRNMGLCPFVMRLYSSLYIAVQPLWLPAKYLVKRI